MAANNVKAGKLTKEFCDSVKYRENSTKSQQYGDGDGLALTVSRRNKIWRVSYVYRGNHRSMSLGSYTTISLEMASKECARIHGDIQKGLDPFEEHIDRSLKAPSKG